MTLQKLKAEDFNLAKTLESGQVFHWRAAEAGFVGLIDDEAVYVEQQIDALYFDGTSAERLARYFALDHSLKEICASFPNDPAMRAADEFCRGLRIIRQSKWECLATFITSSMKQVAHIRQISETLRLRFGQRRETGQYDIFTFPSAERIAQLSEKDLRECALGYRAKNLLLTARRVAAGEANLEEWARLSDDELRDHLCSLPGVGAKVANCVMLFAYERLRAFPIDVWVARVLQEQYFPRRKKTTEGKMREFARDYFGEHGGYAQQYLFHHARMTAPRGPRTRSGSAGRRRTRASAPGR